MLRVLLAGVRPFVDGLQPHVGVDLDYTQIGDGGWGMVLLVASGTAVRIEE